jgi:8-oxo-dGTP pyrophosphatase MutT (NUDIX family)
LALPGAIARDLPECFREFARSDAYKRVKHRYDAITATGILVDRDGRFLLQHRDDKPDIYNPGLWGSFGGSIEPYETPGDGFLRELQEELSWQPRSYELYASGPFVDSGGERLLVYVYAAPVEVAVDALVLGEGQGLAFFAPGELPEATVPAYRALLERFAASDTYVRLAQAAARPVAPD